MNKCLIFTCGLVVLFSNAVWGEDSIAWWAEKINTLTEPAFLPEIAGRINKSIDSREVIGKTQQAINIILRQLQEKTRWLNETRAQSLESVDIPIAEFFERFSSMANETFVQTLIVAPESEVFVMGDLHGSLHSLVRTLQRLKIDGYLSDDFTIIKPNFYLSFLGDYADRGAYATEVIYLLLSLFTKNPDKVFILRGNHEDITVQYRETTKSIIDELEKKYDSDDEINTIFDNLAAWYAQLPVAIYLGSGTRTVTNFIQLSHGGIEVGFDPRPLFNFANHHPGIVYQAITCKNEGLRKEVTETVYGPEEFGLCPFNTSGNVPCGFTWSDFSTPEKGAGTYSGRGYFFNIATAKNWMEFFSNDQNKWRGIIRGHQHHDLYLAAGQTVFAGCNVHNVNGMLPCTAEGLDVSGKIAQRLSNYPVYRTSSNV